MPFYREIATLYGAYIVYLAARRIIREEYAGAIGILIKGEVSAVCGENCHLIDEFQGIHPESGCDSVCILLRNPYITVPAAAVAALQAFEWFFFAHFVLLYL